MTIYESVLNQIKTTKTYPEGFTDWRLADKDGWSLAHEAADAKILPDDFDDWLIATNTGYTVVEVCIVEPYEDIDLDEFETRIEQFLKKHSKKNVSFNFNNYCFFCGGPHSYSDCPSARGLAE